MRIITRFWCSAIAASVVLTATANLPAAEKTPTPGKPVMGEMAGYLIVPCQRIAETYNAGFSMYVSAWPLLREYPGHRFQTGLFGTWMHAQFEGRPPANLYSDVEGGLGWWRDTVFPTVTPKFIMGGVAPNFREIANGPAHGKGNWDNPKGLYGVAQLSPWLLFPIDGLNLKQGTCGELFGYGYLPLPLSPAKAKTAGKDVPTGENCWTLFLNTRNFKGPAAFFLPYFWSRSVVDDPNLAGLLLDSRGTGPNRPVSMETQYIPAALGVDGKGQMYARVAPVVFPRSQSGDSMVMHQVTSYSRKALWDAVKTWFDGGAAVSGAVDLQGACVQSFGSGGGATWKIYPNGTPKENKTPVAWKDFASPATIDPHTYGYRWDYSMVTKTDSNEGPLATLPEYYRLATNKGGKNIWTPVQARDVPAETGLAQLKFGRPKEKRPEPYTTPDAAGSCWKKPGPAAGPFKARLGDGSVVTYYWYRFADQPAMLNADLTDQERHAMQAKVEKLHRNWKKDGDYLPPPLVGKLAEIDPALIVTPPAGMEAGYVPIATRQEMGE